MDEKEAEKPTLPSLELVAAVGRQIEVQLMDRAGAVDHLTFRIVPDSAANFSQGLLGESTPMAQALLGKTVGTVVDYKMGDICEVKVIAVTEGPAVSLAELTAKRQARVQKTAKELSRKNAAVFASSYSGKWGDYDPEGVEHWEEE